MNYLKKRKSAFGYALKGLRASVARESHMGFHCSAASLVILAGFYFHISRLEWVVVLLCITLVLVAELFNTVAERICDLVSQEQKPEIGYIKDISAGAVLLTCVFSVVTGLLVFLPYLLY